MRRQLVRFAALLTLSSISSALAWAHGSGGVASPVITGGHSHGHAGGGGGGFSGGLGGGHAGFSPLGHGGHGVAGPSAGFGAIGHGDRNFAPGTHGVAGFNTMPHGAIGHGAANHLSGQPFGPRSIGAGSSHGSPIMRGITYPPQPSVAYANGWAPGPHSATHVAAHNATGRQPVSGIQNLVRGSAGGGPTEHQVGGQLAQAGQASGNHQEVAGPHHLSSLEHSQHHPSGQAYWNQRSYFFGSHSPFKNSPSQSVTVLIYPWWLTGYGYGFGYGLGYGAGYGTSYNAVYRPAYASNGVAAPRTIMASAVQVVDEEPADQLDNALDFSGQGEVEFKQGKYKAAVQNWRHALVDDQRNGAILLLLGQALFALGQYDEAAAATQAALTILPEEKWGAVVTHYKELYPNIADYTTQIRAAEKARDAKPDVPALHFLLGYHFGYLNYPKQAVRELDKVLVLVPKDKIAQKLRDQFAAKLSDADKAALEKKEAKPADDGKPASDSKPETKPDGSSDKPADGKEAGDISADDIDFARKSDLGVKGS